MNTPNLGLEPVQFYREGDNKMRRFWDLVKQSVIVQGLVTLAFTGTVCYLYVTGQEIPESLIYFVSGVMGFFFGAKQQQITGR